MTETHLRTFVRLAAWRLVALSVTAAWTGLQVAVVMHIVLAVAQYIYERVWLKLDWGKIAG